MEPHYAIGSKVNCGKRSFIIKDYDARLQLDKYCVRAEMVYIPMLSRPIVDGVMQKGGHAHEVEKQLIMAGYAKLEEQ